MLKRHALLSLLLAAPAHAEYAIAMHGEPTAGAEVLTINVLAEADPTVPTRQRTRFIVQGADTDGDGVARILRDALKRRPETVVQLRAARDLPYRTVEPVVLAAARAGATTVRLVTEAGR